MQRNISSGLVSIAACCVTIALADRIGRKPLVPIGSAGMTVALCAMTCIFYGGMLEPAGQLQRSAHSGFVAVVAANIYVIFFNASRGPIMWVCWTRCSHQPRGSALAVCGFAQSFAGYPIARRSSVTWTSWVSP